MFKENTEAFIRTYSHLYFVPAVEEELEYHKEIREKKIKYLRPVNKDAECYIIHEYLNKGGGRAEIYGTIL